MKDLLSALLGIIALGSLVFLAYAALLWRDIGREKEDELNRKD